MAVKRDIILPPFLFNLQIFNYHFINRRAFTFDKSANFSAIPTYEKYRLPFAEQIMKCSDNFDKADRFSCFMIYYIYVHEQSHLINLIRYQRLSKIRPPLFFSQPRRTKSRMSNKKLTPVRNIAGVIQRISK